MPEIGIRKYVVRLSAEERQTLEAIVHKGRHPSAQILNDVCSTSLPSGPERSGGESAVRADFARRRRGQGNDQ
jgi:type IV pilus biogenesis protein CpaD/CtpE